MKIRIDQKAFADATRWAARQLPTRPAHPVHSALRLQADAGTLVVTGYDGAVCSTRTTLDADVLAEGSTIVPGLLLSQIVGQLGAGDLELTLEEAGLTVAGFDSRYNIGTLDEHDYPRLPTAPAATGTVASDLLATAVARVAPTADSVGEAGEAFAGVRVRAEGGELILTATDRYRIAEQRIAWVPDRPGTDATVVIPVKALQEAAKALAMAGDIRLSLPAEGTQAGLQGGGTSIVLRLIAATFPPVDAVLAAVEAQACIEVDAVELGKAARRVQLVAADKSPLILAAGVDHLSLSAADGVNSRGRERMPAQLEGPDELALSMKAAYLIDALSPLGATARISVALPTKPFLVEGDDCEGYRCLIVPQRVVRPAA